MVPIGRAVARSSSSLSCSTWRRAQLNRHAWAARALSSAPAPASRDGRPFRLAVVGSGPAGFYTAYRAMARIRDAKVDMYEALPVPFGLVRFGVAPDHPEVKNCQDKFEEVAASPNFTFVGNVSVGTPTDHPDGCTVPLASLLRHYHAVVLSYGAAKDRALGIPGESSLRGVYSAREFVGWYNGLPEHAALAPDLAAGDEAVIVGQGNVALDVARMLLEDVDVLRRSDIAEHAIETLARSKIRRVHVVGRRGPMQAAFTIKEVRELMKLPNVAFHPVDRSLIPADLKELPRAPRRLMEVLLKGSATPLDDSSTSSGQKSWSLDFQLSPKKFLPAGDDATRVGAVEFEQTTLSAPFDANAYALGTGRARTLPAAVAFRSIGYRSEPLPEFADLGVPFNERWGVISNDGRGRVLHEERTRDAAMALGGFPGLYCAGWVKRGPTGVIASTMEDAFATADAIAEDWASGTVPFLNDAPGLQLQQQQQQQQQRQQEPAGWEGVRSETGVDKARVVDWAGWRKIDAAERERGRMVGKEREKFTRTADMLAVAGG